jgi:hypothetical protein
MAWWWWILPVAAGVLGLLVLGRALAALGDKKPISGVLGALFGAGFVAAAIAAVLAGLDVQTYQRLTYERPVATIELTQKGPHDFIAALSEADGQGGFAAPHSYELFGDEWRIEARVLKWKPWANVLGLDAQYRLNRLAGEYSDTQAELTARRSVYDLHPLSGAGFDLWQIARAHQNLALVDTLYGSAALMPMANGAKYEVWITQSGLIARPVNPAASQAGLGWH